MVLEDNIIGKKILYVDSVGGTGNYLDNDRFNNPCFLNIYNDLLYVIDKNNFCVKVYDLNLKFMIEVTFLFRGLMITICQQLITIK